MTAQRYIPLALALALFLAGCAGLHQEFGAVGAPRVGADITPSELEARIHELVNDERRQRGKDALRWDEAIRPVAREHSAHMARRGYFAHESPNGDDVADRYRRAGYGCRVPAGRNSYLTGGENLFLGHVVRYWQVGSDGTRREGPRNDLESMARAAVEGWMSSPSHRRNLLDPRWRTEAIGVHITADGRVFATQNFC